MKDFNGLMGTPLNLVNGVGILLENPCGVLRALGNFDALDDVIVNAILRVVFDTFKIEKNNFNKCLKIDEYDTLEDEWEKLVGHISTQLAKYYKGDNDTREYIDNSLVNYNYILDPDIIEEYKHVNYGN